jgi:cell division protein ZapA
MADVRLMIASREYIVTCADGEEARLMELGTIVNEMAAEAGGSAGGLNESRTLLYSALLLADKMYEARNSSAPAQATPSNSDMSDAIAMEKLADRIEKLVEQLEL